MYKYVGTLNIIKIDLLIVYFLMTVSTFIFFYEQQLYI